MYLPFRAAQTVWPRDYITRGELTVQLFLSPSSCVLWVFNASGWPHLVSIPCHLSKALLEGGVSAPEEPLLLAGSQWGRDERCNEKPAGTMFLCS